MKRIKKVAAGFLLAIGGVCLLSGAYAPFNHNIDRKEQMSEAMACLLFGLPLTGAGGWMVWRLQQQTEKQRRDRLQSIFYRMLKKGNGHITILQFAMEAQLTGTEARHYLDEQAREFNANFEVNDEGEIFYQFNLGAFDPYHLDASSSVPIALPKNKKRKRKKR